MEPIEHSFILDVCSNYITKRVVVDAYTDILLSTVAEGRESPSGSNICHQYTAGDNAGRWMHISVCYDGQTEERING